jgi:hypothetical protein
MDGHITMAALVKAAVVAAAAVEEIMTFITVQGPVGPTLPVPIQDQDPRARITEGVLLLFKQAVCHQLTEAE